MGWIMKVTGGGHFSIGKKEFAMPRKFRMNMAGVPCSAIQCGASCDANCCINRAQTEK